MVLSDFSIKKLIENKVIVSGLGKETLLNQVNANSLDLCIYPEIQMCVPWNKDNSFRIITKEGIVFHAGQTMLARTTEYFKMPTNICGQIFSKSSWGRLFINHMMAGVIDAGFDGTITLEFKNDGLKDVRIYPYDSLVQIVFYELDKECEVPYRERSTSKYEGQVDVTESKLDRNV